MENNDLKYNFEIEKSIVEEINSHRGKVNTNLLKYKIKSEKITKFNHAIDKFIDKVLEIIQKTVEQNGRVPKEVKLENIYHDISTLGAKIKELTFL